MSSTVHSLTKLATQPSCKTQTLTSCDTLRAYAANPSVPRWLRKVIEATPSARSDRMAKDLLSSAPTKDWRKLKLYRSMNRLDALYAAVIDCLGKDPRDEYKSELTSIRKSMQADLPFAAYSQLCNILQNHEPKDQAGDQKIWSNARAMASDISRELEILKRRQRRRMRNAIARSHIVRLCVGSVASAVATVPAFLCWSPASHPYLSIAGVIVSMSGLLLVAHTTTEIRKAESASW